MKYRTIITALTVTALLSCGTRSSERPTNSVPLPDPLEKSDVEYKTYRRGPDDMVETLYADLVKKSLELQKLENRIESMSDAVSDSTKAYQRFNEVNQQYYASVEDHLNKIEDTSLSKQIQSIADGSKDRYSRKVASHEQLFRAIENKQQEIADIREAIKIILTIPEIQKYQDKNLPTSKPMLELLEELEKLKREMEDVKQNNGG